MNADATPPEAPTPGRRPRDAAWSLTPPRLMLVPPLGVGLFFLAYAVSEGVGLLVRMELGPAGGDFSDPMFRPVRAAVLCLAAVLYGGCRALRFNPAAHPRYAAWLEQTPWSAAAPLPLGPVHLVARDALPLGVLAALAYFRADLNPAAILALAGLGYVLCAAVAQARANAMRAPVLIAFCLPALLFLTRQPAWAMALVAALYVVAAAGMRRSLRDFPWGREDRRPTGLPTPGSLRRVPLGWPLDALAPKPVLAPVRTSTGWLAALLVGWWLYAVLAQLGFPTGPDAREVLRGVVLRAALIPSAFLAFGRLLNYAVGHAPPLGLAGRVFTGRLIIPRYDYVLLAPAAVMAAAAGTSLSLFSLGAPPDLAIAASLAAAVAATINLGPGVNHWKLTGGHRLFPTGDRSGKKNAMVKAG